jgi:hypothetical protein
MPQQRRYISLITVPPAAGRRTPPTFSLITVIPRFFAREPPALMIARVV